MIIALVLFIVSTIFGALGFYQKNTPVIIFSIFCFAMCIITGCQQASQQAEQERTEVDGVYVDLPEEWKSISYSSIEPDTVIAYKNIANDTLFIRFK